MLLVKHLYETCDTLYYVLYKLIKCSVLLNLRSQRGQMTNTIKPLPCSVLGLLRNLQYR